MIFNHAIFFAVMSALFNTTTASSRAEEIGRNGTVPSNELNMPVRPQTAINRAAPTTTRHPGNRLATGQASGNATNKISNAVLAKKIIKKAHKNVRLRGQRNSARGLCKVSQEPGVN